MSERSADRDRAQPEAAPSDPVRYPTNHVIAVLDRPEQVRSVVTALTTNGFLESEIHVDTGPTSADRVAASSGRGGLAGLATNIADWLGIENMEMHVKSLYEDALRDGRFVVRVLAPTEERKDHAADILRSYGAHTVAFHGKFTIEGFVPPATP